VGEEVSEEGYSPNRVCFQLPRRSMDSHVLPHSMLCCVYMIMGIMGIVGFRCECDDVML
jgi:hypothetical protein